MTITKRHRWLAVAALTGLAAGELAAQLTSFSWRRVAGDDPPEDPTEPDFDWPQAVLFGALTGAVVGASVILARGGAGVAWKRTTGRKPPRGRKRVR